VWAATSQSLALANAKLNSAEVVSTWPVGNDLALTISVSAQTMSDAELDRSEPL